MITQIQSSGNMKEGKNSLLKLRLQIVCFVFLFVYVKRNKLSIDHYRKSNNSTTNVANTTYEYKSNDTS